jgi:hypothetical protein
MQQAGQAEKKSLIRFQVVEPRDGSMKPLFRFAIVFAVAFAFVPFLPLYVERTMLHVMFAHGGGGTVEWGWKRCALSRFWSDYPYLRPEQDPALWLTVNVGLAFTYALAIALIFHLVLRNKAERTPQPDYAKK